MRVERQGVGLVFLIQWILATALGVTVRKFSATLIAIT